MYKGKIAVALVGLVALAALAPAQQPPAEPSEAAQRELQAAQDALARAVAEFEGPQQSRSIASFDEVASRLEALLRLEALPPSGRDLLVQAYEYRGRAYFGIGLTEKASESFRLLIQLKPDHALSPQAVSPKIVDLFNAVKKVLTGYLAVSSRPAGARVTLVGAGGSRTDLGLTDFFPQEVLAGEYTVEVAREGYQTETRPLSLAARATESLEFELVRTLASAFFVTEPPGVEIWIDGELRATTGGVLAPDLMDGVRAQGIDPTRASARTEVANLSLGTHALELRRRCYETVRRTLNTELAQDYEIQPVRLEESLASLRLTSDPPGARIFLNGEAHGVTPAQVDGICSGRIRVEVKHAAGKFIKDLALGKDEAVSLDCPIRPTLAFLGVWRRGSAGRDAREAEERIIENLSRLTSLNFIPAPPEAVGRVLEQEGVERRALLPAEGAAPDVVRRVTERLATALEIQGVLIGELPDERLQQSVRLHVLAAGSTTAEAADVVVGESASYQPLIARLDHRFVSHRPWSGLVTVDTLLHQGVPVLRLAPLGPAEVAGIQAGDIVVGVDGQPVRSTAELRSKVAAKKPGESLALLLQSPGGGERGVDLVLGESAREVPLFDPQLLYNKAMMDLRSVVEGYPGTEQAAYARLNLALCALHFHDYAGAHDHLQRAKAELPQRAGLSQGTALYYLGLALDRLGYRPQASEAYRAAAALKEATLVDNDGPRIAPLAERRAGP